MEKVWHGLFGLDLHATFLHHLRALKGAISNSPPSGWPFAVSPRARRVKGAAPDVGLASRRG